MRQQFQWATRTTIEYLDDKGDVEQEVVEIHLKGSETSARASQDAAIDTIARRKAGTSRGPKWQRLATSELIRRPIGEWETVSVE